MNEVLNDVDWDDFDMIFDYNQAVEFVRRIYSENKIGDLESNDKLHLLLMCDKVTLGNGKSPRKSNESNRLVDTLMLFVVCSDVFMWGLADLEGFDTFEELHEVFEYFSKDPDWGTEVWTIQKRRMLPQKSVYDAIMKDGVWNLDEMGLKANPFWTKKDINRS